MRKIFLLISMMTAFGVRAQHSPADKQQLIAAIQQLFSNQPGVFALAAKHLPDGDTVLLNEREMFHAASTMKTPVMIEIFRQAALG
ncbi:MAG: serine hydrolase, partial [Bacteroidota bacterium]